MSYTQAQIDALEAAIATGALTVEYGDKKVTYRSLNEMKEILSDMQNSVAGKKRIRRVFAKHSKGT